MLNSAWLRFTIVSYVFPVRHVKSLGRQRKGSRKRKQGREHKPGRRRSYGDKRQHCFLKYKVTVHNWISFFNKGVRLDQSTKRIGGHIPVVWARCYMNCHDTFVVSMQKSGLIAGARGTQAFSQEGDPGEAPEWQSLCLGPGPGLSTASSSGLGWRPQEQPHLSCSCSIL